ncbi:MAG TPA: hypothetical protein VGK79_07110 [Gaiellaceae bacterium]|jgi:hypothetical protein
MNSAIHQISAAQHHTDALRDALRNPQLPREPKPARHHRRFRLLRRLRPVVA